MGFICDMWIATSTKGFINIVLEDYFDVVVFSLTIMGD
jgi:hypothetical protein